MRSMASGENISFISQDDAIKIDEELMGPLGFSIDQLMELAGLSVACALASEYSTESHKRVVVIAGPGNNGGDGLVAARHLHHFGYDVKVYYPKPTTKPLFNALVTQCEALGLKFLSDSQFTAQSLSQAYDVVLDSIFGFSFRGTPRSPFDTVLNLLKVGAHPPPIVSIDIPSGWDVELGDESGEGMQPEMLVSLTAPKFCAQKFQGPYHYLGGRFVPPAIKANYQLKLPEYPGASQCVRINGTASSVSDMRISYEAGKLDERDMPPDPMTKFEEWFSEAKEDPRVIEANAMTLATANKDGQPSSRVVLLKGFDANGFKLYTNYSSRKGNDLQCNKNAALSFFWEPLQRQVRIEGHAERLSTSESDTYFKSRPRGSQIGAWISDQSTVIESRKVLEDKGRLLAEKYKDESVPVERPDYWGGYLIKPISIEFWQGRPSRLHDRIRYTKMKTSAWKLERLSP